MARDLAGWKCTQCHVLNEPTAFQCFRCGRLREGVVVQAVLPEGTGESITLYEGTATGPGGTLLPHARCSFCNNLLRPDWVACPRCGTKTVVPETTGVRGVLGRFLPWVMPIVLAALAVAGTADLLMPQKISRAGNTPAGNAPGGANAAISPDAIAKALVQQGAITSPAQNGPGNVPAGNKPAANTPANTPPSPSVAVNAPLPPPRSPANAPVIPSAGNPPANPPGPGGAGDSLGKSVDPTPRSVIGNSGLAFKDVAWVNEGGLNEIKGTIQNTSRTRYRLVRFTFDLLDRNGASVGTANDSIMHLRRGASKEFTVLVLQNDAVRCRLKSVDVD